MRTRCLHARNEYWAAGRQGRPADRLAQPWRAWLSDAWAMMHASRTTGPAHHGGRHEGRLAGHRLRDRPCPHLPRPSPGQRGGGVRPDPGQAASLRRASSATPPPPTWPPSTTTPPSTWSTCACPPGCTPSTSCGRFQAGKHVLCELPLAATMADARRIVDAQAASDRQVFVDMFGRFDPATEFLHAAIAKGRYGTLKTLAHRAAQRAVVGGLPDRPGLASPWTCCTAAWTRS